MYPTTTEIQAILRNAGLKVTPQREAVCSYVLCGGCHVTAEQVKEKMDEDFTSSMSLATVYNTLNTLVEAGIFRTIKLGENTKVLYDSNLESHFHFYNSDTGELIDLDPSEIRISVRGKDIKVEDIMIRGTM